MIYSFKVGGIERKQVASIIAEVIGEEVKYQGPPSFNYQTGGWTIDKDGLVTTPELTEKDTLAKVTDALKTAGGMVEGNGTVTLGLEGHNGNTLRNLINIIWAKQNLLQKALSRQTEIVPSVLVEAINAVPIDTTEEFAEVVNEAIDTGKIAGESDLDFDLADQTLSFSFFNASLDEDEVFAYMTLCQKLSEQAKKQKFSSVKQKIATNDRYAMRCFLLRLGFISEEFKTSRKILLLKLDGDAAFRTPEAKQAAEEKRKGKHG